MLVARQVPRDFRAQELARDVDFHCTQAAQLVERRVEVIDKPLIRFGQAVIPREMRLGNLKTGAPPGEADKSWSAEFRTPLPQERAFWPRSWLNSAFVAIA